MEDLRKAILEKATELFMQFGIRSISIDNVCSELHISKKTFYNYFSQKEELIDAVLTYQEDCVFEKLRKLLHTNNAIDTLILIIKEMKKATENQSPALYYDLKKYHPSLLAKHEEIRNKEITNWFSENMEQGIREGYYRDDMDIELIAVFHITLASNPQMQEKAQKYSKKRMIEFYLDMMMHIITNENGLRYFHEHYNKND